MIIKPGEPNFYINKKRYYESEATHKFGFMGIFSGKAIHPEHGVTRSFGFEVENRNLITDTGLNALGVGAAYIRMHLGTGTTAPAFTDTALTNFGVNVAANEGTMTSGASSSAPYYGWMRRTWTSVVGGATGNWTEIGISSQNTNGGLRSHALILNNLGVPTTFPVLADEQFQGTYEFRCYPLTSDVPASITLSGVPYNTISRLTAVTRVGTGGYDPTGTSFTAVHQSIFGPPTAGDCFTGTLGSLTSDNPTGSQLSGASTRSAYAYGSGNLYLDSSCRWGAGSAVGTIQTVRLVYPNATVQVQYSPTITKLTTEEFIHNQRISWDRL